LNAYTRPSCEVANSVPFAITGVVTIVPVSDEVHSGEHDPPADQQPARNASTPRSKPAYRIPFSTMGFA